MWELVELLMAEGIIGDRWFFNLDLFLVGAGCIFHNKVIRMKNISTIFL